MEDEITIILWITAIIPWSMIWEIILIALNSKSTILTMIISFMLFLIQVSALILLILEMRND